MAAAVVQASRASGPSFKGFGAHDWSLAGPSHGGGPQFDVVRHNLNSLGFQERQRPVPSRFDQPYNWMDVMAKYEGTELIVATDTITAAVLNSRAFLPLVALVAPLYPTSQNNITVVGKEYLQIPFDEVATGGIPRETTYEQDTHNYSLKEFKRTQRMTLQAMHDVNFGREMLAEITAVLSAQAQLTVSYLISRALGYMPFKRMVRWFENGGRDRQSCARKIHMDTHAFALAHRSPADFRLAVQNLRSAQSPIDLIVLPEGAAHHLHDAKAETRSTSQYNITYDPEVNRYFNLVEKGPTSVLSYSLGGDQFIDFIENPGYVTENLKGKDKPDQTLSSEAIICDVAMQRVTALHEDPSGNPEDLDVYVHSQSPTSISVEPLRFIEALKWCGVWNNQDGTVNAGASAGTYLQAMIDHYTKTKDIRDAAVDYFDKWNTETGRDNNTTDSRSAQRLTEMTNFRRFGPFVAISNDKRRVVFPMLIGTMEQRNLPNEYLERAARQIIEYGAPPMGINVARLEEGAALGGNLGGADDISAELLRLLDAYLPERTILGDADAIRATLVQNYGAYVPGRIPARLYTAQPGQSLDAFVADHSVSKLSNALLAKNVDVTTPWMQALAAVPATDKAVADYATFVHAAQTAAEPQSKPVQDSVDYVFKMLAMHSGNEASKTILAAAADHLRAKKEFTALAKEPLGVGTRTVKTALPVEEQRFKQLLSAAAVVDVATPSSGRPVKTRAAEILSRIQQQLDTPSVPLEAMEIEDIGAPVIRANIAGHITNTRMEKRLAYLEKLDPLVAIVMAALCHTSNSYPTHHLLARRLGIQLFRINYWRPFQRYRMHSIVGLKSGETLLTPIGHSIVNVAEAGIEGYLNLVVSFRCNVVPIQPKYLAMLCHSVCAGFIGGCDTQFVRTREDAQDNSPGKPSVLALPVPIDETAYHYPLHLLNDDIYPDDERDQNFALYKHSSADLAAFILDEQWARQQNLLHNSPNMTLAGLGAIGLSPVGFKSHVWHKSGKALIPTPGTGPRGETVMCEPGSAKVWGGMSSKFSQQAPSNFIIAL